MKKHLMMAVAMLTVAAGCAVLAPQIDRTADKVAEGVNAYCAEVPRSERQKFRELVNGKTPHQVRVDCAGDAE